MPQRVCAEAGCAAAAVSRGRCREHAREASRRFTSQYKPQYNSRRWKFTRRRVLFERPICEHPGCDRLAVDVHHANGHENFFAMAGLQALCKKHHGKVTRAEQTGKGATP
jgi:hypothetical protein